MGAVETQGEGSPRKGARLDGRDSVQLTSDVQCPVRATGQTFDARLAI